MGFYVAVVKVFCLTPGYGGTSVADHLRFPHLETNMFIILVIRAVRVTDTPLPYPPLWAVTVMNNLDLMNNELRPSMWTHLLSFLISNELHFFESHSV